MKKAAELYSGMIRVSAKEIEKQKRIDLVVRFRSDIREPNLALIPYNNMDWENEFVNHIELSAYK